MIDDKPLAGLAVLVVDDNPDALYLLDRILSHYGAAVVTAEGGRDALARLRQTLVDVVVSDISMPGFSGYDLVRSIRALPTEAGGRTPTIALTGFSHPGQRDEAMRVGFDGYWTKPFEPEALVREIAQLARRRDTHVA